jgi:hypothetical protein
MSGALPATCPFCGAANPNRLAYCPACFHPLSRAGAPAPPPTDPLSSRDGFGVGPVGPLGAMLGRAGLIWVSLGIASAVVGIFFLVAGSFVNSEASTINAACAGSPLCPGSAEITAIFFAIGALGVILGVALVLHGFQRSMNRNSWMTLPP